MKSKLMVMASIAGVQAVLLPQVAKADSVSDLRAELQRVEARIDHMESKAPQSAHKKASDLDQLKEEVTNINYRLSQIESAPKQPAPLTPIQPTSGNQAAADAAYLATVAKEPKPLVGGIPIVRTSTDSFFIAGTLDAGVRYDSGSTKKEELSVQSGLSRASRLTLEGYHELGSGWRIAGVVEGQLNLANGTGGGAAGTTGSNADFSFDREATVAIGSDYYGYLTFGRQYTPIWATNAGGAADPYGGSFLGGAPLYSPALARSSVRANNAITYTYGYSWETMLDPAPRLGPGVSLLYAPGSQSGYTAPSSSGQMLGAAASYGTKDWWVGYGYNNVSGVNASYSGALPYFTPPVGDTPSLNLHTIAASYDFHFLRAYAGFNMASNGRHNQPVTAGGLDYNDWWIAALAPITPRQNIRVMFGQMYDNTVTKGQFSGLQAEWDFLPLKNSSAMIYVEGAWIFNNHNAAYAVGGALNTNALGQLSTNGTAADLGGTSSTLATGIRYIF